MSARYPPPESAIAIFGSAEAFCACLEMYESPLKFPKSNRPKKSRIGFTVLLRRTCNQEVSFGESLEALRIVGLLEGQSPAAGL